MTYKDCKFPEIIRVKREEKGLSQAELAEQLGVARPVLSRWEQAHCKPTYASARKLQKVLGGNVYDYRK